MSNSARVTLTAVVAVLLPILLVAGAAGGIASLLAGPSLTACTTSTGNYRSDQLANAATIVAVGKQLGVPQRGWVVAIAAALQESDLVNVDHGDRDSLGLFQERPSQGWGTPAQVMDPTYAATQFYRHLLAIPAWQQLSVNDAAQAVERSAYPQVYGAHEQAAQQITAAVAGAECGAGSTGSCTQAQAPNVAALAAVTYACEQIDIPYQWGG